MSAHARARLAVATIRTSLNSASAVAASTVAVTTVAVTALLGSTVVAGTIIAAAAPAAAAGPQHGTQQAGGFIRPPCAVPTAGTEQCFLAYRPQAAVSRAIAAGLTGAAAGPRGLTPRAIRAAYRLPARRSSHQTVAVSIAFDTPRLAYVRKPPWQHDRHCAMRTVADVSAVATNVPVFNRTYGGWVTVAGTSIGAPLVAGIYGLAGNGARTGHRRLYRHAGSLFDVTRGDNSFFEPAAQACGGDYLCVARKGYDAPTGLGSPDGTGAF